jgi:hypothetical protein
MCVNERSYRSLPEYPALLAQYGVRQLHIDIVRPESTGERDQEYLCEGMAEEIITGLSGIRGLKVASRTAAFQFRDRVPDLQRVADAVRPTAQRFRSLAHRSDQLRRQPDELRTGSTVT